MKEEERNIVYFGRNENGVMKTDESWLHGVLEIVPKRKHVNMDLVAMAI